MAGGPGAILLRLFRGAVCAARKEIAKVPCFEPISMPAALARKFSTFTVLLGSLVVAGCAAHPGEPQLQAIPIQAAPVKSAPPVRRQAEIRIHRPDRALLKPQPEPDCAFKGADSKTVDKDVFARLKLDYERQCYQTAEKVARERLQLLQASSKCEIEPVRRSLVR
jgi:hypothetical protein